MTKQKQTDADIKLVVTRGERGVEGPKYMKGIKRYKLLGIKYISYKDIFVQHRQYSQYFPITLFVVTL